MFKLGVFPDQLKVLEALPLYKKGNDSNFSNFRTISLLPSFSNFFLMLFWNKLQII